MIFNFFCSKARTIMCLLLFAFAFAFVFVSASAFVGFAAPTVPGGTETSDTGLVDCYQACETEYTKCGDSWLCDLQAAKCLIKCSVAKEGKGDPDSASVTVTIRHKSTMRYLDAHESSNKDFKLVTRPKQRNTTQQWVLKSVGNSQFTLQQKSNPTRYVDAHETTNKDFGLVTRTKQNNTTQRWIIKSVGNGLFTMRQASSRRYVDAHVTANRDFEVVTRPFQANNTQRWLIKPVSKPNFSTTPIGDVQKLETKGIFNKKRK